MAAMVMWPDGHVTCMINENIEGTTQTNCRIMGQDNPRYLTFHNGGSFNIGCNVKITIIDTTYIQNKKSIGIM